LLPKEFSHFLARRNDHLRIFKSSHGTQALIAQTLISKGENVVLLVPGPRELHETRALLHLLSEAGARTGPVARPVWERTWCWLPPMEPKEPEALSWAAIWPTLYALARGGRGKGVILTVDNLLAKWPAPKVADLASMTLRQGEELSPEMILEQSAAWGYRREGLVTSPGEMAMRGDILDIFAPGYDQPLRLEFFGDTLEQIRLFDPSSQRSKADLKEAIILPVAPAVLAGAYPAEAMAHWDHLKTTGQINEQVRNELRRRLETHSGFIFPGLYYPKAVNLRAYLAADSIYLLSGATDLRARVEEAHWAWQEYLDRLKQGRQVITGSALVWPEAEARKVWTEGRQVLFEDLVLGQKKDGLDLPEKTWEQFSDLFWQPEQRNRPWSALVKALQGWRDTSAQTILSFHTERGRKKFLALAEQEGLFFSSEYSLDAQGLFALVSPLKKGMELPWAGVRILSENILQPPKDKPAVAPDRSFKGMASYAELRPGDLLVHRDYGLGRFGGLERLTIGEVANDYLLIHFDGEDKLFLPVDRLRLVQRYQGPEGLEPALDSLRGTRWKLTKERAKKAIEKIAQELVEMYAYRKVAKGYAYGPSNELYPEFEATFGFEETPDQARAIRDVIEDMERSEPMDRLVCGDVGFGKTEVAMRAAFRAVLDGKQVALLCPTTVLAEQHYLNFKNRMQGFPITVAQLSRFVPKPKQKAILQAMERGQVDILIGTHRILSSDVSLPSLGLLILDEEQRFGVKHKEKLKELKKNVDSLTLTATPIPRTLQLSLSGIRGLSVIETPPVDRKPVETALIERDDGMLKTVLTRELERGGQVFWVHNRVQSLSQAEDYVRRLAPEARVGQAHGQMPERRLEETIHKFWHGELDILVCTAIIESGLDFPNANTMVVDQAHMFGLGQLYQLRGRVGRSDRQAYAYFVVPSLNSLSDLAKKRLQVILDMDFLGAGFQVAMEDLRLRGAGNILGEAQSGQIAKVGLDLYLEMLEEEVQRLKGEVRHETVEPEISFVFPAHIPERFILDPGERLRYYRALSAARSDEAMAEIADEMRDRFGHIPQELENFLAVLSIKRTLTGLQVARADLYPGRAVFAFQRDNQVVTLEQLVFWLQSRQSWAKLLPPDKLEVRSKENGSVSKSLERMKMELEQLRDLAPEASRQSQIPRTTTTQSSR